MQQQLASPSPPTEVRGQLAEDLFSYLAILRRGWVYVAVSMAICLTLAVIVASRIATTYQATARLLVLQQGGARNMTSGGDPLAMRGNYEESLATHLQIIRSPITVEQALKAAGLTALGTESVVNRLTVTVPEPTARVIQVGYMAGTRDEAMNVMHAVIKSYEDFLEKNFKRSTTDTINLFMKARDELLSDVNDLEEKYLKFRQKNPSYSTDENGRSIAARRLERWEQAANQAMVQSLHLQSQLEMGKKLLNNGADTATIATALSRLGPVSGDPAISADPARPETSSTLSIDQLEVQLEDLELKRTLATRLLDHLRAGRDADSGVASISEDEILQEFDAEAATFDLKSSLARAQAKLSNMKRNVRGYDPALQNATGRVKDIEQALAQLWKRRKPLIALSIARLNTDDLVRQAETELRTLTAKEAAFRESLAQIKQERLVKARHTRAQLVETAGANDARVRHYDELIARLEQTSSSLDDSNSQGTARAQTLIGSIEQGLQAVESLRTRIKEQFEKDVTEAKDAEIGMLAESNLRHNLERQRALYNSVLDQLRKAQLVSDFGSITAQTLNPPSVMANQPKRALIVIIALLLGAGMGAGIAFVSDQLDTRIRSLSEMRRALNLCVLGVIPSLSREQRETSGMIGLICHALPRSFISEAYKSIRTNFEYLRRSQNAQVVLVSSPQSGDGKSTTASNLAISLAHAGRKVLLVDADMRRPTQHHVHNLGRDQGLPHVLKDVLPLHRAVQTSQIENLDLLLAGPEVSNPAELLASHHLARMVAEMREIYDVVIFDSPPLLAVADPSIIAAAVDAIILVVRTTSTCRPDVERTVELLRTLGTPVLGTVINGITPDQMGSRYGYRYGYGSGYGNRYGYGHGYGSYGNYGTYGSGDSSTEKDLTDASARPGISNGTASH